MTFTSATSLCQPSQLNCGVVARLAQTGGGVTSAVTTSKVTDIGAVAGSYPSEVPGLQSAYLNNVKLPAGSGYETRSMDWIHANTYTEALCAGGNCETGL